MTTRPKRCCPSCGTSFDGGSIWQYFYNRLRLDGYWDNTSPLDHEAAEIEADKIADNYGATRTKGRWGREIHVVNHDRTTSFKCPDCNHEWDRA